MLVDMSERAARVRAARAYANLNPTDLAGALNLSVRTYARIEAGERVAVVDELRVIARLCNVPNWFLERGFQDPEEGLLRELEDLRAADEEAQRKADERFARLDRRLEEFSQALRRFSAELVVRDAEALRRTEEERKPTQAPRGAQLPQEPGEPVP